MILFSRAMHFLFRLGYIALLAAAASNTGIAAIGQIGADQPWTTYEAEAMRTNGAILGPKYEPFVVEMESSGERCVKLIGADQFVEFTATAPANTLIVRYSLPDAPQGGGVESSLVLVVNGRIARTLTLTSHYAHVYGRYPFTNDPKDGRPRNFYDELRLKGLGIAAGDVVRVQRNVPDAPECLIDLVDLENAPAPLNPPQGALSIKDFGAAGDGKADDTAALKKGVAAAAKQGGVVWVPAGDYVLTGDIVVPSGVTIQGAGMWHTTFVGEPKLYGQAERRVRFKLAGKGMRLADFAIIGRLDYRNDSEPNDGLVGADCEDAAVERIWVEHTKVGAWIYNGTRVRLEGCRFRNLLADGVNLCVGANGCVVENCSARGTGDDCYAIWPVPSDQGFTQRGQPGNNVIRRCTGQLPFLANGGSLYGGAGNRIEDCLFTDITPGCGILISTTFPTTNEDGTVDNNFSGETVAKHCLLLRCGGYDHDWAWRGALQICMDRRSIRGLAISDIEIRDSLSDAISVVGPGSAKGQGTLAETRLEHVSVGRVGLGLADSHALHVRADARGGLTLIESAVRDSKNEATAFSITAARE